MLGLLGASVELVRVRAHRYGAHNRTRHRGPNNLIIMNRETGPDLTVLTWQWTLSGSRRVRRARGRL